jgi:hypothetical protein
VTWLTKRPPIFGYSCSLQKDILFVGDSCRDLAYQKTFSLSAILVVSQLTKRPPIFGYSCRVPAYQEATYLSVILVVT